MSRRLAGTREKKRREGVVSSMNFDKGFGRIVSPPSEVEYFFHATDVQILDEAVDPVFEDFNTGDIVTFMPLLGKKGWRGLGVRRVGR